MDMATTSMVMDLVTETGIWIWALGGGKEARNGWLLWPREHFRHLPDTGCTARLSSPSVKSRSTLTQEISPRVRAATPLDSDASIWESSPN